MSMNQLEKRIQLANLDYRKQKIAIINKVEVPILITNSGLIPRQSTVDFTGIYKVKQATQIVGQGIAFDVKETLSKTSFPLSNIKQHQLTFLEYFQDVGGTAFFFIHFKKIHTDKAFVTPLAFIQKYWYDESSRRSLPYSEFNQSWLTNIDQYLSYFII